MSILDNIYKSSSNVAESLDTTAETLQMMSKADAKEYSEDRKFRKYEKERDKKDRQDRAKIVSGVTQRLDNAASDARDRQEQGGQGMGLAVAGLAAIIAANVKKYVQKNPYPNNSSDNDNEPTDTSTDTNNQTEDVEVQGYQSGGFAGKVPNIGQPATGDHYYTSVQPGSYILNRNAVSAMGFQSGGSVPVALEQGEIALPPGSYDRGLMDFMNYSAYPRFQQGGLVGDADDTGAEGEPVDGDAPVPTVKIEDIKPGGKIDFIGDGSGFTGEFTIFDGAGKKIAAYGAASGNSNTREATQEERSTVYGKNLPLPDGDYPLMGLVQHPGQAVGEWSDYINSANGSIGGRSELLIHPDVGLDGTAGCVGVQLGGGRMETESEKKFLDIYKAVQPKRIKVDLDANGIGGDGSLGESEDSTGTPSNTTTQPEEKVDPLAGAGAFAGALKSLFGELDSALGLGSFGMSSMGILFGNPFGDFTGEGDSPLAEDSTVENTSGSEGAISVNDPNAKALLNAIAVAEGTANKPNNGYNTMFTGTQFKDLDKHPAKIQSANGLSSDAAGRYQFLSTTWSGLGGAVAAHDGKSEKQGISFSAENQDRLALKLVQNRGVNIVDGLNNVEIRQLGKEWASIKGGGYGQAYHDEASFMKIYKNMGGKPQKKQGGGAVMPVSRGVDKLQGMIREEVENFFEQSNLSTQAEAMMGEPTVVFAGGGEETGGGSVSMSRSSSNLPAYDIQPRDNCPLSMYYMYNPSFNPMGLGVQ